MNKSSNGLFAIKMLAIIAIVVVAAVLITIKLMPSEDGLYDARGNRLQPQAKVSYRRNPKDPLAWERNVASKNTSNFGVPGAFLNVERGKPPYTKLEDTDGPIPPVVLGGKRWAFFTYESYEGELLKCTPDKDNYLDISNCIAIAADTRVLYLKSGEKFTFIEPKFPLEKGKHYALRLLVPFGGRHINLPAVTP